MRVFSKQQYRGFMNFQSFLKVVCVRFGKFIVLPIVKTNLYKKLR